MQRMFIVLLAMALMASACKKNDQVQQPGNNTTSVSTTGSNNVAPITLPDSVMIISGMGYSINNGAQTIQLLDAGTGKIITSYVYSPYDTKEVWTQPFVGNGLLYDVTNDKINAININTGVIQWTDSVKNFAPLPSLPSLVPVMAILHNTTFYALYPADNLFDSFVLCAIDATKPTTTPIWKYAFKVTDYVPTVNYYNGSLYLSTSAISSYFNTPSSLAVLDANTGNVKWTATNPNANYLFNSLNSGLITSGNEIFDANSGNQIATVTASPLQPSSIKQSSALGAATQSLYFFSTTKPTSTQTFVSALAVGSQLINWTTALDSSAIADLHNNLYIEQVWNNQLVTQTQGVSSFTGAGSIYGYSYTALDINTGKQLWSFPGGNVSYLIANNILYTYGTSYGSGYYQEVDQFALPVMTAIDMETGKMKWSNASTVGVGVCMLISGKGYSPYIQ